MRKFLIACCLAAFCLTVVTGCPQKPTASEPGPAKKPAPGTTAAK